jgi:pimeloyl-ACP methyl ester carboxylesterase
MVRERRIAVAGRQVRYLESGAGWPLVLLHAFPLHADMWRPQLEQVADGWRFIAPDLPGFGPEPGGGVQSIDELADGVLAFLDALKIERTAIGGLSMGGYVTLAMIRREPERFSHVMLADTRATADAPAGLAARQQMLDALESRGVTAVAEMMLPKLLGASSHSDRPDVVEAVRDMIERGDAEGFAGGVRAMRDRPDSSPLLARIGVPALVVVGDEDVLTPPSDSEAMAGQLPRSRLVKLARAGHLSNLESPRDFSVALCDFLTSPL